MREFTDKIFHRSRRRTDVFQGDGSFFSVSLACLPSRTRVSLSRVFSLLVLSLTRVRSLSFSLALALALALPRALSLSL